MDMLKKIFPLSFGVKDLGNLIVKVLIYLVVGIIAGVAIGILAAIPVINLVTGIAGTLVDLYCVAGIVIAILDYLKILK
ncbi:MAG: hypothetical protein IJX92_05235 [Clostridia bacterium]|nr:hypothetical protein [Clostridia bacterium]